MRILNNLAQYINSFLSLFDIKIIKLKPYIVFRPEESICHNPRTILGVNFNKNSIFRVPLNKGRTSRWFDLGKSSRDPALFFLRKGIELNLNKYEMEKYLINRLNKHNDIVRPNNAGEQVGLKAPLNNYLSSMPYWAKVLPWEDCSIEERLKSFPNSVKQDRKKSGLRIKSDNPEEIMLIDKNFSIDSHVHQYLYLLHSIRSKGLISNRKNGYISAFFLFHNNSWRWILGGEGNHRAIVASALNMDFVDVCVEGIIRYDDLEWWPNVCNGLYTKEEAEFIFESIFYGTPSFIYENWINHLKNQK